MHNNGTVPELTVTVMSNDLITTLVNIVFSGDWGWGPWHQLCRERPRPYCFGDGCLQFRWAARYWHQDHWRARDLPGQLIQQIHR